MFFYFHKLCYNVDGDNMDFLNFLEKEKSEKYFIELDKFIKDEYSNYKCHPKYEDIFNSFKYCLFQDIKIVLIGQDPYHNDNQAHGLSFSVLCEKLPPSLKNIYKEMSSDLNTIVDQNGDLTYLAKQGVLLLNTILTVRHNEPLSHKNKGWEIFTDKIIKYLDTLEQPICFILWGNNAISKELLLTNKKHFIIKSAHPSPLSAYNGFFGSKPFSKANDYLIENGITPIKWTK